jgi:hypothetical protein
MRKRGLILASAMLSLIPSVPADVHAQNGFLFGKPKAQLTLRAGPVMHRAGGDVFELFRTDLTLDRGDFRAPAIGGEVLAVVHPRLDLVVGASWSKVDARSASIASDCVGSEFECTYVDDDGLPIEQMTTLRVIPVTASVRYYPLSRGEGISELAWVPARTTPYIGGGGGIAWYRLAQTGEFVSVDDEGAFIFPDDFESSGRGMIGHVHAGVDHWFTARLGANFEGRYSFGSARPDRDFLGWDSIDLSGLQLGLGLALRW